MTFVADATRLMDKIDSLGESSSFRSLRRKKPKKGLFATGRFSALLGEMREQGETDDRFPDEEAGGALEEILSLINESGEALVKSPTLDNVKRYRERVKRFLQYVVDHVVKIEEKTSGASIRKRKRYLVITTIDAKLEDLAKEFLNKQAAQLDLLSRVNEINGLLIDLLR